MSVTKLFRRWNIQSNSHDRGTFMWNIIYKDVASQGNILYILAKVFGLCDLSVMTFEEQTSTFTKQIVSKLTKNLGGKCNKKNNILKELCETVGLLKDSKKTSKFKGKGHGRERKAENRQ